MPPLSHSLLWWSCHGEENSSNSNNNDNDNFHDDFSTMAVCGRRRKLSMTAMDLNSRHDSSKNNKANTTTSKPSETRSQVIRRLEQELMALRGDTSTALTEHLELACHLDDRLRRLDRFFGTVSDTIVETKECSSLEDSAAKRKGVLSEPSSLSLLSWSIAGFDGDNDHDPPPAKEFAGISNSSIAAKQSVQNKQLQAKSSNSKTSGKQCSVVKQERIVSFGSLHGRMAHHHHINNKRGLIRKVTARQETKIRSILGGMKERIQREEEKDPYQEKGSGQRRRCYSTTTEQEHDDNLSITSTASC